MITCPNCGASVYPQTQVCPRCQARLVPPAMPAPAGYPITGEGDTVDGMPAWVRAVQGQAYSQQQQRNNPSTGAIGPANAPASAYAQVPPPAQPQGSLSLSEMINEENLPEWLRGAADAPDVPLRGQGASGYRQQQGQQPGAPQGWQAARGAGTGYMGNYSAYAVDPHPTGNMATPSVPSPYQAPPSGAPTASAASLLDESALPDWLRQTGMNGQQGGGLPSPAQPMQQAQQAPNAQGPQGMAAGYPGAPTFPQPEPSSAFPRIDQVGYGQQPAPPADQDMRGGMAAQSLLDPRALPGWLGGNGESPYAPQQSERAASIGMPASSLVDEQALPQWLRNEPATPSQRVPAVQPGVVSQWITGASDEPLPTWLNQVYSDAQVAPAPSPVFTPAPPFASPLGAPGYAQSPENANATPQGMTGRQFVEESALPEWLRAQGATPAMPNPQGNGYGAPPIAAPGDQYVYRSSQPASGYLAPNGQANPTGQPPAQANGAMSGQLRASEPDNSQEATFSAYDLIDPDALPSWVNGANGANGASSTNGRIPAGANGANNGGGTGSLGRMSAAAGWDEEANEPPITPTSRRAATLGQTMSRSGRVPVPPANQPGQLSSQTSQSAQQGWGQAATGRMRLDDTPEDARNQPTRQAPGGRQAPQRQAPQRAPGTGSLRQPPPEQQLSAEELPGWLRAGAAHVAPPEVGYGYDNGYDNGYGQNVAAGFPDGAQEEPIWDDADWGLPPSGNAPQGAQPQQYTARARAPMAGGRRPPDGAQPGDQRKRGWRRIFGR